MTQPTSYDDLSPDQQRAYDGVLAWSGNGATKTLTLAGFAGCGKTTVTAVVAKALPPPVAFITYTGKASSVLRRKLREAGIETISKQRRLKPNGEPTPDSPPAFGGPPYCGTIHSLIYKPCHECMRERTKDEPPPKRPCPVCADQQFILREDLDRQYSLLVVDEASMVDDDTLDDLRSFNIPILAVGDHGQLPPVKGAGSLMRRPDIRLEKIHRQAEKNPIIALSKAIREDGDFNGRFADGKHVRFLRTRDLPTEVAARFKGATDGGLFDMAMISYTNKRRVGLNMLARKVLGFSGAPAKGEQVICLRNMRQLGVFNGMRGVLEADSKPGKLEWIREATISFPEDGIAAKPYLMCVPQFCREKTFQDVYEAREEYGIEAYSFTTLGALFDFGYAMTCHKVQGSQFSDVLVVAERFGMDADTWCRWAYTATTRASKKLTVLR